MRELYDQGWSLQAIADHLETSKSTVDRRLGPDRRPRSSAALAAVPVERMAELYQQDWSLSEIAAIAGIDYQTVRRRLTMHGVPLRAQYDRTDRSRQRIAASRRIELDETELRRLHAQQMSCREIAAELGVSDEKVRDELIRLDLPRLPGKARPERNYFWKGGYAVDDGGYILQWMPEHPEVTSGGYVRQHRLVMERELGRPLLPTEVVDHRNGDTSDNRPENLRVFPPNGEHLRVTRTGRCKLPPAERELLRQEAVRRAHRRVAAILAESGTGADRSR
jgi:predicted DNA-binding protein YlxM (UPF0122 family)